MSKTPRKISKQAGVALFISLVMLLVLTIAGVSAVQTTSLEERMARNTHDRLIAFQAAESALREAEVFLLNNINSTALFTDGGGNGMWTTAPFDTEERWKGDIWDDGSAQSVEVTAAIIDVAQQPRFIVEWLATVERPENIDYAGGHLRGSLNIGLAGKFATWAGTVLDPKIPIVLITEPGTEQEAIQRLGRIGFDQVTGYLDGGMQALLERPDLIQKGQRISAQALAELLTTSLPPMIVDVRSEKEWAAGHVDQSVNIPLPNLATHVHQIPADAPVVVHCASGYRSSTAMGILVKAGRTQAMDLVGGYDAWIATWG